jgi:4-hydroxymandelate oxidase
MGNPMSDASGKPLPPMTSIPQEIVALEDYEPFAQQCLDDNAWTYLTSGAADEITLAENRRAYDRIRVKGRVLRKLQCGHTRLELFGQPFQHPIFLAPVAYQRMFHPEGELASAMAADAMDAGMVVSTQASVRLEDVARAARSPLWFQLYMRADREQTLSLVRRAEDSGYKALVVTVDAPVAGIRNKEQRAGFQLPPGVRAVNLDGLPVPQQGRLEAGKSVVFDMLMAAAPTWDDLPWLASSTRLPVLVKGILDAEDAVQSLNCGAAGIIVSNHGGRIQDTVPATIEALPLIAQAVGGRAPILVDGGIRRGSDVFKAIALGASAVLIGRPYIYALAAAGALGVAHAIRTLREELEIVMALNGCATLQAIDRNALFNVGSPSGM